MIIFILVLILLAVCFPEQIGALIGIGILLALGAVALGGLVLLITAMG